MTRSIKTIGIVGGGQLARMLTFSAKKMGFTVIVSDPTPNSPAGQVADKQLIGDYKDERITRELAKLSDVVTVDAEFVNDEVLEKIAKKKPVHPSPQTIKIIKDKLTQKKFLKKNKILTAEFTDVKTASNAVETKENILKIGEKFGYPFLLKARFDAYDGKGNVVIKNEKDIEEGLEKLQDRKLYVEKFVPFEKEIAIMVGRNTRGEIKTFPVVETIHKDNICDTVIAPAPISRKALKNAEKLAISVIKQLKGAGVFGIEMFLLKNNLVLVNEIAPRVHNSGHYTIEGAATSQFEQHIRAITGLPLGQTNLLTKSVVMKNILGKRMGKTEIKGLDKVLKIPLVSIHVYGKMETRIGRKMGHITVVGNSITQCLRKANLARKSLTI